MYKHFFKRFIDVVLAFIGVVVLALPMLIIALVIKLDSRGPAFFKQVRLGLNGKEFTLDQCALTPKRRVAVCIRKKEMLVSHELKRLFVLPAWMSSRN